MKRNIDYVTEIYCLNMIAEAKRQKCWMTIKGKWLTPDEFMSEISSNDPHRRVEYEHEDIKLVEPFNAIVKLQERLNEKIAALNEEQLKINEFAMKVAKYYKELS